MRDDKRRGVLLDVLVLASELYAVSILHEPHTNEDQLTLLNAAFVAIFVAVWISGNLEV